MKAWRVSFHSEGSPPWNTEEEETVARDVEVVPQHTLSPCEANASIVAASVAVGIVTNLRSACAGSAITTDAFVPYDSSANAHQPIGRRTCSIPFAAMSAMSSSVM